jgi:hypothetical protein
MLQAKIIQLNNFFTDENDGRKLLGFTTNDT